MNNKKGQPSAGEFKILEALQALGQGTVADVQQWLKTNDGKAPAYMTVMTLLKRLRVKEWVNVDERKEPFVFSPKSRVTSLFSKHIHQLVKRMFRGDAKALVMNLVSDELLTAEDLRKIEQQISGETKK